MNDQTKALKIKKELPRGLIIVSYVAIILVLSIIPFIAWLLEYKDTISAPLTITTKTTPVDIFARTAGELELLVKKDARVKAGTGLAVIKNTADYDHIQRLKSKLTTDNLDAFAVAKSICQTKEWEIGELNSALVELKKALNAYETFIATDQHQALMTSRLAQISHYKREQTILSQKAAEIAKEQRITAKIAEEDSTLFQAEAIAERIYDITRLEKIGKGIGSLDNEAMTSAIDIEIEDLKQANIVTEQQFDMYRLTYTNAIKEVLQKIESEIADWELKYLLKASIDGTCIFKDHFNDYRFVQEEEKVFSLLPDKEKEYFGLLQLPIVGAGKVRKGLEVNVKLNNYPFIEFGMLKGEVTDISLLPFEQHYNVQVGFPDGFFTSYNEKIELTPLMLGIGEVIVERKSLYDRIADQVKSIRYNRN